MINAKLVNLNEETFAVITPIISVIISLFYIIILAILCGIVVSFDPSLNSISNFFTSSIITIIVYVIILGLLIGFMEYYLSAKIYNLLLPHIKGIQFELTPENKIAKIDTIPTAITFAIINTIWSFIVGLLLVTLIGSLSSLMAIGASAGVNAVPEIANFLNSGVIPIILILILIGLVIFTFIGTFIWIALISILYNVLAKKVSLLELDIIEKDNELEIKSVNIKSLILSFGLIMVIVSIITNITTLINNFSFVSVISIIIDIIIVLVTTAIVGYIYNVLASKIYGYKFQIDPSDNLTQTGYGQIPNQNQTKKVNNENNHLDFNPLDKSSKDNNENNSQK